jgi:hypothetical protein
VRFLAKTIKVLKIEEARLNEVSGRRVPLVNFTGSVEIIQEQTYIPMLGRRCKGEKRILASVILCEEVTYLRESDFNVAKTYEAEGAVIGDQRTEKLLFSGLKFADNDPIKNTITFEITDMSLIQYLLKL